MILVKYRNKYVIGVYRFLSKKMSNLFSLSSHLKEEKDYLAFFLESIRLLSHRHRDKYYSAGILDRNVETCFLNTCFQFLNECRSNGFGRTKQAVSRERKSQRHVNDERPRVPY